MTDALISKWEFDNWYVFEGQEKSSGENKQDSISTGTWRHSSVCDSLHLSWVIAIHHDAV